MEFEILPPVPAVLTARQLRHLPLFAFASVDELFRFSAISRQVRHKEGSTFQKTGAPAEYIQVLLEGKALVSGPDGSDEEISPPAILGFREVLEGTPLRQTARAEENSICLALGAEDFRGLIADNIELAEGLFRMLLDDPAGDPTPSLLKGVVGTAAGKRNAGGRDAMKPIDKALLLQELPLFSRATAEELLHLAGIARETDLVEGTTLFGGGDSPSIWIVLDGEISMEGPEEGSPTVASAGDVVGIDETLTGRPLGHKGQARQNGEALRIERESLFDLLSNRVDFLQGIFGALFQSGHLEKKRNR
jgi:CRP-like cAMP-binding protein